jgi:hypothetical protein
LDYGRADGHHFTVRSSRTGGGAASQQRDERRFLAFTWCAVFPAPHDFFF